MAGVRLIAGLGNPGSRYAETRHNIGFHFLDAVLAEFGGSLQDQSRFKARHAKVLIGSSEVHLVAPMTFMNASGDAVGPLARYFRIEPEQVLVAYDEVAFEPGVARLKAGGGHNGHNGIKSLIAGLGGSREFLRLRLGVGHPGDPRAMTAWLTSQRPQARDRAAFDDSINAAMAVLPLVIAGDLQAAMTRLHTDSPGPNH